MHLAKQVAKFHLESLHGLNIEMQMDADDFKDAESDVDSNVEVDNSESDFEEDEVLTVDWENVDTFKILLPSRYSPTALKENHSEHLIQQEKELCEGQMNDALSALCQSLGDKAWLLRKKLRGVKSTKTRGTIRKNMMEKMHCV